MALPARVIVSSDTLFHVLKGESVLLNLQNDHYYGLDDVGTRMWQLLAETGDPAAVVQALLAAYPGQVDETTLRQDLAALIGKLTAAGLLAVAAA